MPAFFRGQRSATPLGARAEMPVFLKGTLSFGTPFLFNIVMPRGWGMNERKMMTEPEFREADRLPKPCLGMDSVLRRLKDAAMMPHFHHSIYETAQSTPPLDVAD